jgi:hypothetical protein
MTAYKHLIPTMAKASQEAVTRAAGDLDYLLDGTDCTLVREICEELLEAYAGFFAEESNGEQLKRAEATRLEILLQEVFNDLHPTSFLHELETWAFLLDRGEYNYTVRWVNFQFDQGHPDDYFSSPMLAVLAGNQMQCHRLPLAEILALVKRASAPPPRDPKIMFVGGMRFNDDGAHRWLSDDKTVAVHWTPSPGPRPMRWCAVWRGDGKARDSLQAHGSSQTNAVLALRTEALRAGRYDVEQYLQCKVGVLRYTA